MKHTEHVPSYEDYRIAMEAAQSLRAQEIKRMLDGCYTNINSMAKKIFQKPYGLVTTSPVVKMG